jgi:hypothetical protein
MSELIKALIVISATVLIVVAVYFACRGKLK